MTITKGFIQLRAVAISSFAQTATHSAWSTRDDRSRSPRSCWPRGLQRLVVDFGLLTGAGYRANVVRTMRLEPVPGVFTRDTVLIGWGTPQRAGKDGETPVFFYQDGLIVYFDKEGWVAARLLFTPPQPAQPQ